MNENLTKYESRIDYYLQIIIITKTNYTENVKNYIKTIKKTRKTNL